MVFVLLCLQELSHWGNPNESFRETPLLSQNGGYQTRKAAHVIPVMEDERKIALKCWLNVNEQL